MLAYFCLFLQKLGGLFSNQTTLGTIFSRIFSDFAQIFKDFGRIFDKSKLCLLHHNTRLASWPFCGQFLKIWPFSEVIWPQMFDVLAFFEYF